MEASNQLSEGDLEKIKPRIIPLQKLRAGETPFTAWHYSALRVNRGGEEIIYKIPIKSIGVIDILEKLARKAPTPPRKIIPVRANSPEGKMLGLKMDRMVESIDEVDEAYREASQQFEINSTYSLVLHGLAMDIEDANGKKIVEANDQNSATKVSDEDAAIQILKGSGFAFEHIQKLAADIRNLTKQEEVRIDLE
jgi:hypothetical protein